MSSKTTQVGTSINEARTQDPVRAPWGFYLQSRRREVADGFLWFESWVKVLRFLRRDLLELTGHDDRERQEKVRQVVDDLIECRHNKQEALGRLNQVLEPIGQILWWGGLSELASGEENFAQRVRSEYADGSSSALPAEQLADFAASLRNVSL